LHTCFLRDSKGSYNTPNTWTSGMLASGMLDAALIVHPKGSNASFSFLFLSKISFPFDASSFLTSSIRLLLREFPYVLSTTSGRRSARHLSIYNLVFHTVACESTDLGLLLLLVHLLVSVCVRWLSSIMYLNYVFCRSRKDAKVGSPLSKQASEENGPFKRRSGEHYL